MPPPIAAARRQPRHRQALVLTALVAMLGVAAFLLVGLAGAVSPGPDFEIDGNLAQDTALDDWETVLPGPSGLGVVGVLIDDPHSKSATDPNILGMGGKFYDTSTWSIVAGSVGAAQNELVNVAVYAVPAAQSTDTNSWLVTALERTKKQGTFALWTELNQDPWDGSGVPNRTEGDLAVGYELSGNPEDAEDFEIAILVYSLLAAPTDCDVTLSGGSPTAVTPPGSGTDTCPTFNGNWQYRYLGPAGALGAIGEAQMNLVAVDSTVVADWDSFTAQGNPRDDIGEFQFAESAINLNTLGITVGCPGFGSTHAVTVASLSSTADAKDLGGPEPLPISCEITGTKYEDNNVDGLFDAGDTGIADWPISLYLDDGNGTFGVEDEPAVATTFTCGGTQIPTCPNGDSTGDYRFSGLSDGVYHVVEGDAPDGGSAADWQHQNVRSTDGTAIPPTLIQAITINAGTTSSSGNDFLNAQPPDLRVEKTDPVDPIEAGDTAEFTITVTNDGPGGATNVVMDDHLPVLDTTNAWSISGTTGGPTCGIDAPPLAGVGAPHDSGEEQHLRCTIASLADDASFSVTIQATTTGEDCGTITNTATVGADNEPAGNVGSENTDTETTTVNCPDIAAAKSGTISYTASVTNDALALATADGVTLTDNLPGDLTWEVTAITDPLKCVGQDASGLEVGDDVPGNMISCSGIELAPGASFSVSVQASISDAIADCAPEASLFDNTVTGTATNQAAADEGDDSDSAAICAVPAP